MPADQEQSWAVALAKARQQFARQSAIPLGVQKKRLAEGMAQGRAGLIRACRGKRSREIEALLLQLIDLKAAQTALALEELKEMYGGRVEKETVAAYAKQYTADCVRLVRAVRQLCEA